MLRLFVLLLPVLGASALRVPRAPLARMAPRAALETPADLDGIWSKVWYHPNTSTTPPPTRHPTTPPPLPLPPPPPPIPPQAPSVRVEGESLRTWNMGAQRTERVQVSLRSTGRPIHSNVELWHTPGSYVPMQFSYVGLSRDITAVNLGTVYAAHPATLTLPQLLCQPAPIPTL